jgi:hypothetical protein
MLNYAGEVLLALGLVLFSLLSYWLVWKLNGLGWRSQWVDATLA